MSAKQTSKTQSADDVRFLLSDVQAGRYVDALKSPVSVRLIRRLVASLVRGNNNTSSTNATVSGVTSVPNTTPQGQGQGAPNSESELDLDADALLAVGTAGLNAFLQATVTGPVLEGVEEVTSLFISALEEVEEAAVTTSSRTEASTTTSSSRLRTLCLSYLTTDGVTPYAYAPRLELFCLSRYIFLTAFPCSSLNHSRTFALPSPDAETVTTAWLRLRVLLWHYRLLAQVTLGAGNMFARLAQWSEAPSLREEIVAEAGTAEEQVLGDVDVLADGALGFKTEVRVGLLLELVAAYILMGMDGKAREALGKAAKESGFVYALSGALGKRTRFQERGTSQLVVLAKSAEGGEVHADETKDDEVSIQAAPEALKLNDDTLLERIAFGSDGDSTAQEEALALPAALSDLKPGQQPALRDRDRIILLAEATLRDAFSPASDSLTVEEILPFAVRVLDDNEDDDEDATGLAKRGKGKGSVNWQVFTQALLVRSRIEVHRSRTVERAVLQMQALVDQAIVDTDPGGDVTSTRETKASKGSSVNATRPSVAIPSISITDGASFPSLPSSDKATSFLRRSDGPDSSSTSAPAPVRLRFVHALPSSPPRWHLESELAHAWVSVGSLVSALEIFRRLRMWAEAALCFAAASGDSDGDGANGSRAGGEDKARAILRWRLFRRITPGPDDREDPHVDLDALRSADFTGPLHDGPAPPNAPRLLCLLGDLEPEQAVAHYELAWAVSGKRFARAQRSLGDLYSREARWPQAKEAYKLATAVDRQSSELWTRLGDVQLRLAEFEDAAEAYARAVGAGSADIQGVDPARQGEGAKTWSNLGTALWSLWRVRVDEETKERERGKGDDDEEGETGKRRAEQRSDDEDGTNTITTTSGKARPDSSTLLAQSLAAFKRGASLAHDNWRIWDNVATLAWRMAPPSVSDVLLALVHILRIRKTEAAVDKDLLAGLLQEVGLWNPGTTAASTAASTPGPPDATPGGPGIEDPTLPPRGTPARRVTDLVESRVVPLITYRSDLWALTCRARAARGDWAGAVDAAERGWRAAVATGGSGLVAGGGGLALSAPKTGAGGKGKDGGSEEDGADMSQGNWLVHRPAWDAVVARTDELVAALENWGPRVLEIGETRWKGKARAAVRSVMGKGKESWQGSEGWKVLEGLRDGLKG